MSSAGADWDQERTIPLRKVGRACTQTKNLFSGMLSRAKIGADTEVFL